MNDSPLSNSSETIVIDNGNTVKKFYLIHKSFFNKPIHKNHCLTDWELIENDLSKVTLALCDGKTLIPSYIDPEEITELQKYYQPKTLTIAGKKVTKDWSIDHSHIDGSDILIVDYDVVSVNELKDTRFIEWAFLGYPTPSAELDEVRGWTKHRWLIKLPAKVSAENLSYVRKEFLERYCSDSDFTVTSTQQIIYGRKLNDGEVLKVDLECILPFEIFSDLVDAALKKSQRQKEIKNERSDDAIVNKIDNHFFDYISENSLSEFIEKVFPNFEWNLKPVSNEADTIERLVCSNPFSASNISGTSLCWMLKDDGRIIVLDRANNYSCNFAEFHARYQFFQDRGIVLDRHDPEYKVTLDKQTKGINFVNAIKEVDKKLAIAPFKFDDSQDSENEPLNKYLRFLRDKGGLLIYYWDFNRSIWRFTQTASDAISGCVYKYVELFKSTKQILVDTGEKDPDDRRRSLKETQTVQLTEDEIILKAAELFGKAVNNPNHSAYEFLSPNWDYVGLADKTINIRTKEEFQISPEYLIFERKEWTLEEYDNPTILERYRAYFLKWAKKPEYAELLEIFLIGQMLHMGIDLPGMLFLVGKKRTGKGLYCEAMQGFNSIVKIAPEKITSKESASFVFEQINEYTSTVFFDELSIMRSSFFSGVFKNLTGGSATTVTIDRKKEKKIDQKRDFLFLASYETRPILPSRSGDGLSDRIAFMELNIDKEEFDRDLKDEAIELFGLKKGQNGQRNLRALFNHIVLNVSPDELIERYQNVFNSDTMIDNRNTVVIEDNPVCEFIECLISNPEKDETHKHSDEFTSNEALHEQWMMFMRSRNETYHLAMSQTMAKRTLREIISQRYESIDKVITTSELSRKDKAGKPLARKINGKVYKGTWGLKLISTTPNF